MNDRDSSDSQWEIELQRPDLHLYKSYDRNSSDSQWETNTKTYLHLNQSCDSNSSHSQWETELVGIWTNHNTETQTTANKIGQITWLK